jgi:hypothetical protein
MNENSCNLVKFASGFVVICLDEMPGISPQDGMRSSPYGLENERHRAVPRNPKLPLGMAHSAHDAPLATAVIAGALGPMLAPWPQNLQRLVDDLDLRASLSAVEWHHIASRSDGE